MWQTELLRDLIEKIQPEDRSNAKEYTRKLFLFIEEEFSEGNPQEEIFLSLEVIALMSNVFDRNKRSPFTIHEYYQTSLGLCIWLAKFYEIPISDEKIINFIDETSTLQHSDFKLNLLMHYEKYNAANKGTIPQFFKKVLHIDQGVSSVMLIEALRHKSEQDLSMDVDEISKNILGRKGLINWIKPLNPSVDTLRKILSKAYLTLNHRFFESNESALNNKIFWVLVNNIKELFNSPEVFSNWQDKKIGNSPGC